MGLEPAFAQNTAAWPMAGFGVWPAEPEDPEFAIPRGALSVGARDTIHKIYLADQNPILAVAASAPLAPKSPAAKARSRKWLAAVMASCAVHVAVAMFFIARGDSEQVLIAGSAEAGITLLGNAAEDQSAAGDISDFDPTTVTNVTMVTMLDAKPVETIEASAVTEPEVLEAVETESVETPVTETVQPATDQPVQPAVTDPLPEILATDLLEPVEDENIVQKPVEVAKVEPVETEVEAAPAPVSEKIVAEPEPVKPEPKPKPVEKVEPKPAQKPQKKAEQPKKADNAPAKKERAAKAGSGGSGQADTRKGEADGAADGTTTTKGKNGSGSTAGNAAVSNYPGKVLAKLRRALRGISTGIRAKAQYDVHVSFIVDATGGVGGLRVVQSSGSPELDSAAVEMVRRAAPFPPIPPEAGRSSWQFTLPLGLAR